MKADPMVRDFSEFLPTNAPAPKRAASMLDLMGWTPFFARQTSADELTETPPVRVTEVHRTALHVIGEDHDQTIPTVAGATVGDWLLLNPDAPQDSQVLERTSLIKRRAPGSDRSVQLIAANIDTAFIVSSCNQDFNVARLERYIALAFDAEITPVILLTKADLVDDTSAFTEPAAAISDLVDVVVLDARGDEPVARLEKWCKPGKTIAFLGSSGVGKSTLTNALLGAQSVKTQGLRMDDAKGRHTTTRRQLHRTPGGCLVLDTPGMRELQLTDAAAGIGDVFADLSDLATACRFNDCRHDTEPGCAITAALDAGQIDAPRVARWRKLLAEEAHNTATLAQRRSRDKSFGKLVRQIQKTKKR